MKLPPASQEGVGKCKVKRSCRYGRYLVTSQDVSSGDVLFQECPIIIIPKVESTPSCLCCMKLLKGDWTGCLKCGGPVCAAKCFGARHTGRECSVLQRMGFKQTQHIDALIKELNLIIGPLRLLLLIQESSIVEDVVLSLESHAEKRRKLPIGKFVEEYITRTLRHRLGLDLPSEIIEHLCGVLDTNSFEGTLDNNGRHGRAVFSAGAMLNHSCVPNAQWWFWKGRLIVQAAVDIRKDQPVLINYTQTLWGSPARGAHLAACKMFTCSCERCLDPTELGTNISSIKCRVCGGVVNQTSAAPQHHWVCDSCGTSVDSSLVEVMVRAAAAALTRLQHEEPTAVSAAVMHLSRVLGPQHNVVIRAKHCYLEAVFRNTLSGNCILFIYLFYLFI